MDTGLHTLVAIARFHQVPAEPEPLSHQFCPPGHSFSDTELLLAARTLTFKAKLISLDVSELSNDILPAIAKTRDGHNFILAKKADADGNNAKVGSFLIHDLCDATPRSVDIDELENLS